MTKWNCLVAVLNAAFTKMQVTTVPEMYSQRKTDFHLKGTLYFKLNLLLASFNLKNKII